MFTKGYEQTKEHQAKAKVARQIKNGTGQCFVCGEDFAKYTIKSVLCNKPECRTKYTALKYRKLKESNPTLSLAYRLSGSIRMGRGKIQKIKGLLDDAVGTPCDYCGEMLTIGNASLDHKEPRHFGKVWNKETRAREYSKEEMARLDAIENLHIVCRSCNQLKSDMNDDQYRTFLLFINKHPDIGKLLKKRLNFARGRWTHIFHR
jgi:5-methylcytosine-specific restriction endonuclease McrA